MGPISVALVGDHPVLRPEMDAPVMVSDIQDACMRVIMLTIAHAEEEIYEAISTEVDGHVIKSELEHLMSTIRSFCTGQSSFPLNMLQSMAHGEIVHNALESLSPREMEIVELVKQGLPNKIIAYKLKLSENTVRNHLRNIMEKLGLKNRVQVATLALKEDWRLRRLIASPQNKVPLAPCV